MKIWKSINSRAFRKAMYRVARELPDIEKFGLASQVRRAAVSFTNNISEGYGRFHFLDQIKFMLQARASMEELIDDLNVCLDEQYFVVDRITSLKEQGWRLRKLIDGYIRYLLGQIIPTGGLVREEPLEDASREEFSPIHDSRCNELR